MIKFPNFSKLINNVQEVFDLDKYNPVCLFLFGLSIGFLVIYFTIEENMNVHNYSK